MNTEIQEIGGRSSNIRTADLVGVILLFEEIRVSREAALDFSPGREPWETCSFGTSSPERAANLLPPFQGFVFPLNPKTRAYALGVDRVLRDEMARPLPIDLPLEQIKIFCPKWRIREFALFRSVLRDDFRPDSDVDVLVSFQSETPWSLWDLVDISNTPNCPPIVVAMNLVEIIAVPACTGKSNTGV